MRRRSSCSFAKISKTASSDGVTHSACMASRPTSPSYGGPSKRLATPLASPALHSALAPRHSSHGTAQYVSIRYSEHLAEAGIEPSVGSVGGNCDNALAETINGLHRPRSSIGGDMVQLRSRRVRRAGMRRLVQQTLPSGAHRKHAARRGQRTMLCHAGRTSIDRII